MKTKPNEPCPCGSGKKHKKCCGNPNSAVVAGQSKASPEAKALMLFSKGKKLEEDNDHPMAFQYYENASKLDPHNTDILVELGKSALELKKNRYAEHSFNSALESNPNLKLSGLLAACFFQRNEFEAALKTFLLANEEIPHNANILFNIASCYMQLFQYQNAEPYFSLAYERDPDNFTILNQYSLCFAAQCKFKESISLLVNDLERSPNIETQYRLGWIQLLMRQFVDGWKNYEKRWESKVFTDDYIKTDIPKWNGEPVNGRVLLWSEQGLGDSLVFASLVADALKVQSGIVISCIDRMAPVFRRAFPTVEVIHQPMKNDNEPFEIPGDVVAQLPLGSICQFFRNHESDFKNNKAYLIADETKMLAIKSQYAETGKRLVGVAWSSKNPNLGKSKSMELTKMLPILNNPDCKFINLQYGDVEDEVNELKEKTGISVYCDPQIDQLKSMDDFINQVAALDLVITTSNTTAHVAGALGIPCWVLLSYNENVLWYWGREHDNCLWYPDLKLFRCSTDNIWNEVVDEVAQQLKKL